VAEKGQAIAEAELNRLRTCGGAQTFHDSFRSCLTKAFPGLTSPQGISADNCSVSLGKEAIEFLKGSEVPVPGNEEKVRALADCLYLAQVNAPQTELDNIDGIYIDGHADAESGVFYNLDLSAKRAFTIYSAYLERVTGRVASGEDHDAELDDTQRGLLSRVFPRTYGEMKPLVDDTASRERLRQGTPWPQDRRVTITIVMKLTPHATGTAQPSSSPAPASPPAVQN
jgi:outer membrane protein OmpA-like peptidoglycan-associated protein